MPKETHTQCSLTKGPLEMVSWIPSEVAKVGNLVRLKDTEGIWTEGWQVRKVYATMDSPECRERSQDYKRTRKASDV